MPLFLEVGNRRKVTQNKVEKFYKLWLSMDISIGRWPPGFNCSEWNNYPSIMMVGQF